MIKFISAKAQRIIRKEQAQVVIPFCVVVLGATMVMAAVLLLESATFVTTAMMLAIFVLLILHRLFCLKLVLSSTGVLG